MSYPLRRTINDIYQSVYRGSWIDPQSRTTSLPLPGIYKDDEIDIWMMAFCDCVADKHVNYFNRRHVEYIHGTLQKDYPACAAKYYDLLIELAYSWNT